MKVRCAKNSNYYITTVKMWIGEEVKELHAVIDTGAASTTVSLDLLAGGMASSDVVMRLDGARDLFVIGNDFLNMCNYQHKAGERQLVIENPNAQKYYDSFGKIDSLEDGKLNTLVFGS